MSRLHFGDVLARNSHPSDEELVAFVSSELDSTRTANVQKHLDACWHCQAREEEFKQAIIEIVQQVNAYVGDLKPQSRIAKAQFEQDLERLRSETKRVAPFSQLLELLESHSPARFLVRQAAFVAVCVVALLGILPVISTAPVSAEEFFLRSKSAEQQSMQAVPDPAIHGRFRVVKTDTRTGREQSMTWEIWNDTVHGRVKNRVEDERGGHQTGRHRSPSYAPVPGNTESSPLLRDLTRVFSMNGIDARRPLSPSGFDQWRTSFRQKQDEVFAIKLPGGVPALAVRTTPAVPPLEGHILTAELIVRAGDWHPVEDKFTVQGADATQEEYDVQETAFQVVTLASIPLSVFGEAEPMLPARLRSPRPRPTPAIVMPTAQQLEESEVFAKFALHRADEFLRGQIQVEQDSASHVKVEGMVDNDARKAELTGLLQSIPLVEVRLRTTEEALNELRATSSDSPGTVSVSPLPPAQETAGEEAKRNQAWMQSQWARYRMQFPGVTAHELDLKVVELSNQAIALTAQADLQAWALRRLAHDYPAQRVLVMSPWSRWLLAEMVQDHARTLDSEMGKLNALVRPVLSSFAISAVPRDQELPSRAAPTPLAADSAWQEQVEQLFARVDEIDGETLGLFGNVTLLRCSPEVAVQKLLQQLPQFTTDAHDFAEQVGFEITKPVASPEVRGSLAPAPI